MLSNLIEIMAGIDFRRSLKWNQESLLGEMPDISTVLAILEEMHRLVCHYQSAFSGSKINPVTKGIDIPGLVQFRFSLGTTPWPDYNEVDERQLQFYLNDTLFYMGISYCCVKAVSFHNHLWHNSAIPSFYSLLPRMSTLSQKRIVDQVSAIVPAWLQRNVYCSQKDFYHQKLTAIQQKINLVKDLYPFGYLLETYLALCREHYPVTQNDEKQQQSINVRLLQLLSSGSDGECNVLIVRQMVMCLLKRDFENSDFAMQLSQCYVNWLKNSEDRCNLSDEFSFWELHCNCVAENVRNNYKYMRVLLKIMIEHEGGGLPVNEKIIWTSGGETFVRHFLEFIQKGAIMYKGHSDITPIVTQLNKFIAVEKGKGAGFLTFSSLMSYFKKVNAEVY
jgi:hypothetical protein